MPTKTKIIFITTFVLVILILLGVFFFLNKSKIGTGVIDSIENKIFNPFGTSEKVDQNEEEGTNSEIDWVDSSSGERSRFYQITNFAVAGAGFFEEKDLISNIENTSESTQLIPLISYVERASGHIYQMDIETKNVTKISNSTIPNIHEVLIGNNATSFIYRYLSSDQKTITSFVAKIGEDKSEFLPLDIININLSPDKTKSFYLTKNTNGVLGSTLSFEDNKKTQVFNSSFSEWNSEWVKDQTVFLTTKPSYSVFGSLFSLNLTNGTLTKLFGGVEGLTTLANKDGGSFVLYGASLSTGPKLWLLDVKEHTTKDLDTYGLPEKCVRSSDNIHVYCGVPNTIIGTQYPDYWYQGLISFDDFFVKINTETGEKVTLANSKKEIPVDATNLFLDKEENNLFFINKKDSTLWSLSL